MNALFEINFSPCREGFLKNQQFFVQGNLPILQSLGGPHYRRVGRFASLGKGLFETGTVDEPISLLSLNTRDPLIPYPDTALCRLRR